MRHKEQTQWSNSHTSSCSPRLAARADQPPLLEDLTSALSRDAGLAPGHSVTALRGLGKELWRGVDAQHNVNAERAAWNG